MSADPNSRRRLLSLALWAVFAVGALLWTLGALATSAFLHWSAGLLAAGDAVPLSQSLASMPIPAWLTYWVDVQALHATLDGIVWTLESAQRSLPWLATVLRWLQPLTWVLWALGVAVILLAALGTQMLVRRLGRGGPPAVARA